MRIGKVTYDADTSEVLVRRKSGSIRVPFSVIGPIANVGVKDMQEDVFDLLDKVSKRAFNVFNNLKYHRSLMNNVTRYVSYVEMSKTDKETLSRSVAELKAVGLIRSVPGRDIPHPKCGKLAYHFENFRTTYVINPEMIRCRDHDEAEYLWNQCGGDK